MRLAIALALVLFAFAAPAHAKTVTEAFDGRAVHVQRGDGLTVVLSLDASPWSYSRWKIVKAPARRVLGRGSVAGDRVHFSALGLGTTSLRLAYAAPGAKPEKTFSLRVKVVRPPRPRCDDHKYARTVVENPLARVFSLRRHVDSEAIDVVYGCKRGAKPYLLDGGHGQQPADRREPKSSGDSYGPLVLNGVTAGFAIEEGCWFLDHYCGQLRPQPLSIEAQDLPSGRVLRLVTLTRDDDEWRIIVPGLVTSPSGGAAWIELRYFGDRRETSVHRSDSPAPPGADYASGDELLDSGQGIDPASLRLDGGTVRWTDGGTERAAPLR